MAETTFPVQMHSLTAAKRASRGVVYLLLIISAVIMIVPFLWMLSTSLKGTQYILDPVPQLIPNPVVTDSYTRLFDLYPVGRWIFNSLLVAALATGGQLLSCSMAAYAFARIRFRGSNLLFLLYLATMMVPFQVTVTPLFILMRNLGWVNSYQSLILPQIFSAFGTFLLRQSFQTIPRELEESAFLDGASHLTVYRRIILPLARPALATLAVFAFMGSWNAFLWPLFAVNDPNLMTLPVGLSLLRGRYLTEWNLVMAGSVITIVPMLIVYIFAQKYLVKGFVMSGLKG